MTEAMTAPPASPDLPIIHQRLRGAARVGLQAGPSGTRLRDLYQQGSAKAFLPRVHASHPEIVFLNTAGGLTGGDRLDYGLELGAGAVAVATTQTAERAYASLGPPAAMDVALSVGPGGWLAWLPQETILFDRSVLHRRTVADLQGDAGLLICETVVLGRVAMGERLHRVDLADWREVRRDGVPVLVEPLALTTELLARRHEPALLGDAVAVASMCLIAPGAEAVLARTRAALQDHDQAVVAAASGWDGRVVVRAMARDAWPLRLLMARLVTAMGEIAPPRVWAC